MHKISVGLSLIAVALSVYAVVNEPISVKQQPLGAVDDQRMDRIEQRLDDLSDEVLSMLRAQRPRDGAKVAAPGAVPTPGKPSSPLAPPAADGSKPTQDQMSSRLAALENKLRKRNPWGQWMASVDELDAVLELTSEQSKQAKGWFDEVKDQTLELLAIANEEGVSPLDAMVSDFHNKVGFKKALNQLVERMEATIPGSDESYADRMRGVESELFERFQGTLSDEQFEQLKTLNIAPSMVHTGYDPVGEYIRKRVETR